MPLPVIFKFISDTSGSKFDKVINEMGEVRVGSEKAGRAVSSLASFLRDGQDPTLALTGAFENFSRSLKLGLGATVAIAGAIEIFKSFVKNADDMNKATESLNNALKNFRDQADTLDVSGAIAQIRALTKELEKASKVGSERPEDRFFGSIADSFFGGAKLKGDAAQDATRQAIRSAKLIAEESAAREANLLILKLTNQLEYERVTIIEKYNKKIRETKELGEDNLAIQEYEFAKAIELEQVDLKFAQEKMQRIQKEADEKTRLSEQEAKEKERLAKIDDQNHQLMLKQIEARKKAVEEFYRVGFEGASTLLEKVREAAERQGRKDIIREVDRERSNQQKATDRLLIENLGAQTGDRRFMGMDSRMIESERISGFASMEGNLQRESNNRLFKQVESVRLLTRNILESINDRLGVPILRSAN